MPTIFTSITNNVVLVRGQLIFFNLRPSLDMLATIFYCVYLHRTNLDCDLLEQFLLEVGGGNQLSRIADSGKESSLSCRVLAGMRPTHERRVSNA